MLVFPQESARCEGAARRREGGPGGSNSRGIIGLLKFLACEQLCFLVDPNDAHGLLLLQR